MFGLNNVLVKEIQRPFRFITCLFLVLSHNVYLGFVNGLRVLSFNEAAIGSSATPPISYPLVLFVLLLSASCFHLPGSNIRCIFLVMSVEVM